MRTPAESFTHARAIPLRSHAHTRSLAGRAPAFAALQTLHVTQRTASELAAACARMALSDYSHKEDSIATFYALIWEGDPPAGRPGSDSLGVAPDAAGTPAGGAGLSPPTPAILMRRIMAWAGTGDRPDPDRGRLIAARADPG